MHLNGGGSKKKCPSILVQRTYHICALNHEGMPTDLLGGREMKHCTLGRNFTQSFFGRARGEFASSHLCYKCRRHSHFAKKYTLAGPLMTSPSLKATHHVAPTFHATTPNGTTAHQALTTQGGGNGAKENWMKKICRWKIWQSRQKFCFANFFAIENMGNF